MGNPFIIYQDEDSKSTASDDCRNSHPQAVAGNIMGHLSRHPFRAAVNAIRERGPQEAWLPVAQYYRAAGTQAMGAFVDPDRSDADSMPDLVTAHDWDRYMSDSDDDGGHIIEEYAAEEATALLPARDWLTNAHPFREVSLPNLVAPELMESNVLAEWASQRRPRTRPDRADRPLNAPLNQSAEQIRLGMRNPAIAETVAMVQREWERTMQQREGEEAPATAEETHRENMRRITREMIAQAHTNRAEAAQQAGRMDEAEAEAAAAAAIRAAAQAEQPRSEDPEGMQGARVQLEARRQAARQAAEVRERDRALNAAELIRRARTTAWRPPPAGTAATVLQERLQFVPDNPRNRTAAVAPNGNLISGPHLRTAASPAAAGPARAGRAAHARAGDDRTIRMLQQLQANTGRQLAAEPTPTHLRPLADLPRFGEDPRGFVIAEQMGVGRPLAADRERADQERVLRLLVAARAENAQDNQRAGANMPPPAPLHAQRNSNRRNVRLGPEPPDFPQIGGGIFNVYGDSVSTLPSDDAQRQQAAVRAAQPPPALPLEHLRFGANSQRIGAANNMRI